MDLDLFARDKQAIEACAERWAGKANYPTIDNNTPQSAIVLLNLPGEEGWVLGRLEGCPNVAIAGIGDHRG